MALGPKGSKYSCSRSSASFQHTCTYSNTLASPISLVADTLVAGNALGTTLRIVLLRELVTHKDEIDTGASQLSALTQSPGKAYICPDRADRAQHSHQVCY